MSDGWTDALVSRLRELWATPLSAAEIARNLGNGISRSAVLGKAMRLKLAARRVVSISSTPRAAPAATPRKKPIPQVPRTNGIAERIAIAKEEPGLPAHPEEPAVGSGVQLVDLTSRSCRWPFGDPLSPNFYFCGVPEADLESGRPYCPFHTRKA